MLETILRTSQSRTAEFMNKAFKIISDEQGQSAIPNYVAFQGNGSLLVGFASNDQALANTQNNIYDGR